MMYYDLAGNSVSHEKFIQIYSNRYFKNYEKNCEELEEEIKKKVASGIVDIQAICWKLGRKENEYSIEDDLILNGYRNPIFGVHDYLCYIENIKKELEDLLFCTRISRDNIIEVFKKLRKGSPDNFGTVYIITVMYFLSKGKIPIYDQFAHKAVKAIYFNKTPDEIYVGSAPSKNQENDATNLLMEYMWYLEQIFGKCDINRSEDQALWAYGHVKHKKA